MATRGEIERHYDTIGTLHALRLEKEQGDFPDYHCALFDGDFTKSLHQAQEDNRRWTFEHLGLGHDLTGKRVLDIGCGWGPILDAVRRRGGMAVGLTLSPGQVAHCTARGLDARLKDYKDLEAGELGRFDAITSIGAMGHFCSVDELLAGCQEEVYRTFFRICAERLPAGGRLSVQTMTWGPEVPDPRKVSLDAPPDSVEAIVARMQHLYPGSWLPNGLEQLAACARDHFDLVLSSNGRLDYLETLRRWDAATGNLWNPRMLPRSLRYGLPVMLGILTNRDARIRWRSVHRGDQSACFEREIISHQRMFFERR